MHILLVLFLWRTLTNRAGDIFGSSTTRNNYNSTLKGRTIISRPEILTGKQNNQKQNKKMSSKNSAQTHKRENTSLKKSSMRHKKMSLSE